MVTNETIITENTEINKETEAKFVRFIKKGLTFEQCRQQSGLRYVVSLGHYQRLYDTTLKSMN